MRNLINIFFILYSTSASLFASASASSGNEDIIVHLKEHKGQVSSFFVGDSIAQVENYTLVPAYKEEHGALIHKWSEESSDEPFYSVTKYSILISPTAQQALLDLGGKFLVYLDTIPVAEVGLTSTVGLDWVSTQKNSYCLTRYVAKTYRGKGVGRAATILACQFLDKLRTIQGLENLTLFAECDLNNTAALGISCKIASLSFCYRRSIWRVMHILPKAKILMKSLYQLSKALVAVNLKSDKKFSCFS